MGVENSFSIHHFGDISLSLQASCSWSPEHQAIYLKERSLGASINCWASINLDNDETRWAEEHRCLQHIQAGFWYGGGYRSFLGHNVRNVEGSCRLYNHPHFRVEINGQKFLSSSESEYLGRVVFRKMEIVTEQIHSVLDALLKCRKIPGHKVEWIEYLPERRRARVTQEATGEYAEILFVNKNNGPVPELLEVYFNSHKTIYLERDQQSALGSQDSDRPYLVWGGEFPRVFLDKEEECSPPPDDGDPVS